MAMKLVDCLGSAFSKILGVKEGGLEIIEGNYSQLYNYMYYSLMV